MDTMESQINPNAKIYYESAKSLLLPAELEPSIDGFTISLGKYTYFFKGVVTPFNPASTKEIGANKFCVKALLQKHGFPTPKGIALHQEDFSDTSLTEITNHLRYPLVIKPMIDSSLGRNVLCGIENFDQLKKNLLDLYKTEEWALIEEFHQGLNSYRILVFNKKVLGIVQRFSARVTGDGIHTVEQLIYNENLKRKKISDTYGDIIVDEECLLCLKQQKHHLTDIPAKGEVILLAYTCNATRGGTYVSYGPNQICKENKTLAINVAKMLSARLVGIDVECEDIHRSILKTSGVIIETNMNPSMRIHDLPLAGPNIHATRQILKFLIKKHPLQYLIALYKHPIGGFYVRASLLVLITTMMIRLLS